jgi:hypothetical protein
MLHIRDLSTLVTLLQDDEAANVVDGNIPFSKTGILF